MKFFFRVLRVYLFRSQPKHHQNPYSFRMSNNRWWRRQHHLVLAFRQRCQLQCHLSLMFGCDYQVRCYCYYRNKRFVCRLFLIWLHFSLTHYCPPRKSRYIFQQSKLSIANITALRTFFLFKYWYFVGATATATNEKAKKKIKNNWFVRSFFWCYGRI